MRTTLTLILFFTFSIAFSQSEKIIGTWQASKGYLTATKKFSQSKCLTEFYLKDTRAKTNELETDYKIENDSLFDYWKFVNSDKEVVNKKESFKIVFFSDSLMKLKGESGDIYEYKKLSSEIPETNTKLPNTFYYDSFGLGCISDTLTAPEYGYENCLCFGEINFKTSLNEYIEKFGEPDKIMDNEDGSKYYIFILSQSEETFSYFAVQILNNETIAIQLTGKDSSIPISFSTIKLGDYFTYVSGRLGKNYIKEEVEEITGFIWDYNPFPFSIEFKDLKVYSIRLTKK